MTTISRSDRQAIAIDAYKRSNGHGTLAHCTGFGKTKEAIDITKKIKERHGDDLNYIVVVPTTPLKDQWEALLEKDNHRVLTIQGIVMRKESLQCDFLIIDEIHKFAAEQFSLIFELIKYRFVLGLTATFERLDGKEELINKFCPVVDTVTLEEARRNGWVADFTEYNWGIEFSDEERKDYVELNERIEKHFAFFNTDYQLVIKCCGSFGANKFIAIYKPDVTIDNKKLSGKQLVDYVTSKANVCRELFSKRKDLLDNAPSKIDAVIEAINYLQMKTVTFGTSTNTVDVLTDRIGSKAVSYHSGIPSEVRMMPNKKGIMKPRKVGKDTLLEMVLQDFDNDKYWTLNTAKKADLGLDVRGLQCAIIYAGSSDPGVQDQRRGRVTRKEGDKEAIILNIYIKNSKDEYNLKARQKNSFRIRWINSINQIEK